MGNTQGIRIAGFGETQDILPQQFIGDLPRSTYLCAFCDTLHKDSYVILPSQKTCCSACKWKCGTHETMLYKNTSYLQSITLKCRNQDKGCPFKGPFLTVIEQHQPACQYAPKSGEAATAKLEHKLHELLQTTVEQLRLENAQSVSLLHTQFNDQKRLQTQQQGELKSGLVACAAKQAEITQQLTKVEAVIEKLNSKIDSIQQQVNALQQKKGPKPFKSAPRRSLSAQQNGASNGEQRAAVTSQKATESSQNVAGSSSQSSSKASAVAQTYKDAGGRTISENGTTTQVIYADLEALMLMCQAPYESKPVTCRLDGYEMHVAVKTARNQDKLQYNVTFQLTKFVKLKLGVQIFLPHPVEKIVHCTNGINEVLFESQWLQNIPAHFKTIKLVFKAMSYY